MKPCRKSFCRTPARCILAVALAALAFGDLRADIKVLPERKRDKEEEKRREALTTMVPEVKSAQVSLVAGQSVEIELEAAAALVTGLRFVVREAPKHGTLSAIRPHPTERHKAVVTYTHTDLANLVDVFTYAGRVGEGPFSAPARILLTARLATPQIEVRRQPMFDRVLPGTQILAKALVTNAGIGPYAADLVWPPHFRGPPRLELAVGETAEIAVIGTPSRPGLLNEQVFLQPGVESSRLRLWLQCEQPFLVTPSQVPMKFDRRRELRVAQFKVTNATRQPMKLKVVLPPRLEGPEEIEVGPNQLKEVEIVLKADDVTAFTGEVLVTDSLLFERLKVNADATPGKLELVAPASGMLQFGSRDHGEIGRATVAVANRGGEAMILAVQAPPPFRIPDEEQALSVAAGASRELTIEATSPKAGKYEGLLVISSEGRRVELKAEATFVDPAVPQITKAAPTPPTPTPAPTAPLVAPAEEKAAPVTPKKPSPVVAAPKVPRPKAVPPPDPATLPAPDPPVAKAPAAPKSRPKTAEDERPVTILGQVHPTAAMALTHLSFYGKPIAKEQLNPNLKKLERIEVRNVGKNFVEIAWDNPHPDEVVDRYHVERSIQVHEPVTGLYFRNWVPVEGVEPLKLKPPKEGLRIKGLQSGAQYDLRFMAVDGMGRISPPSDIHVLRTQAPMRMPGWLWPLSVLAALLGLLWFARKLYFKRMGLGYV